ncbi:MAG TPA: hypothetical protein VF929_07175 [Gemmatimonadaceae bacterium]
MKRNAVRALTLLGAAGIAAACGEVPTLAGDIAYISPLLLPSPAIAAGDVLRDSLGNVAVLSVVAYDQHNSVITGLTPSFLVSSFPVVVSIDANGRVTAQDTVASVQLVGRVGDRLQTVPATLEIVPQPDSMAGSSTIDSLRVAQSSSALQVNVTGLRGGNRVSVKGIIVRYRISRLWPARPVDPTLVLFPPPFGLTGDFTRATDTTHATGASRAIQITTNQGIDSVEVTATGTNLRGESLRGSPVRFVLPVKRGP